MARVDDYITGVLTGGTIEEMALSSKHMRIVAGEISKIEDPDVRQQVTTHFSDIFSKANPRFDHARFTAAATGAPLASGDARRSRDNVSGGMTRTHFQQSADMLAGGDTDLGAGEHIERIHSMMNPNFKPDRFRSRAGMGESVDEASVEIPMHFSISRNSMKVNRAAEAGGRTAYSKQQTTVGRLPRELGSGSTFADPTSAEWAGRRVKGHTDSDVSAFKRRAKEESVDEAEIPMNYSFKRKERGPGMVATSSRVELDARGNKQNVTRSEIVKPERSTGKSYGLWKSQPAGSPERPAGVRPVQPTQRLTPPGGPNAQTNAPKRPSTPSWHSEAPKPYRPTESLADKARRVVDEYIEDVRAEVREALSMPSSGTTSTSTGSTTKSSSSPGKVSTTVPAASAVSTGSTKTKSI